MNYCQVCEKNRRKDISKMKTYNGTFVEACPSCKEEMKITALCMKLSADQMRDKLNSTEYPCILEGV